MRNLEEELRNLRFLANDMSRELINSGHPKAEHYKKEINKYNFKEKPFKKEVKKYWILLMYRSGKTVDEIQELTKAPRKSIQHILRRTAKYRLEMEYKKCK